MRPSWGFLEGLAGNLTTSLIGSTMATMSDRDKLNEFVTTKEAARTLGVTQRRVLQAIAEKVLEAVKMGGRWLVRRDSVYRYKGDK